MELVVSDETLRDGEQQVGVNFSAANKILLEKKILSIGFDHIDTRPAISKHEERVVTKLSSLFPDKVYAATMMGKEYIDHASLLGVRNIILFSSLSDRLLKLKGMSREQNVKKVRKCCRYARKKGMNIIFAGEDSTRADNDYTVSFIRDIEKYIEGFLLCDTVGVLTSKSAARLVRSVLGNVNCDIGTHFHNDRGMADKNTVTAVESGANIVSGTFGGIGERAGNADLCKVLLSLKKNGVASDKINYSALRQLKKTVYRLGGSRPAKPYSARAFWHESGIHVHALLKDRLSYNSFLPEKYDRTNRFFFGKFSGVSGYRYLLGEKYSDRQLSVIRDRIKELAQEEGKSYSEEEARNLAKEVIRNQKEVAVASVIT